MKLRALLIGCFFALLAPVTVVHAVGEFSADYDVQYAVAPSGITIVTQNVTLTNQISNLYAQKYSIVIDSTKVKNIIAYDNGGIITPQIGQENGKTQITLLFNDRVVGLGKKMQFSLRYEDSQIAAKNGSIWEVNIPGVSADPDMASYVVSLRVPPTFGPNAYLTPLPAAGGRWTKNQMTQGGISAAYGESQIFDANLAYYLDNPTISPVIKEIALPPDTAFQKVNISSIEPKPKTVLADRDGNWLAQYELLPAARLNIQVKAQILVRMSPMSDAQSAIEDPSRYTRPLRYWESQNSEILKLATDYSTPRAIYQYVVNTLAYDYDRVNEKPHRKGAAEALRSPKTSICMEFTDLFIAIARAAGIPARESIGFAYTNNAKLRPLSFVSDVLHAWPEYYDAERKLWIPVDPTWADTTGGVNYFDKLDFNHITFAILGESSELPYPAGFYKKNGEQSKDINIQFSERKFEVPQEKLTVEFIFPKVVNSGMSGKGSVVIENTQGVAVPKAEVAIRSTPHNVSIQRTIEKIPPYAKVSIPIEIPVDGYFEDGKGSISVSVNDEISTREFDIQPFSYLFIVPIAIGGIILSILAYAGVRYVWKNRKTQ